MNHNIGLLVITGLVAALAVGVLFWLVARRFWWRGLKPLELEVQTAQVGEWSLRYHRHGRGPDILFLHGIGANLSCWRHLIPHMRGQFTCWAIDLPGFGGSSKNAKASYGLDEQCQRLIEFMDTQGLKRVHVVGNSMGGNIALWLAHSFPERVNGVAVIAPATSPRLMPLSLHRLAWLARPAAWMISRPAVRWAHLRTVSRKDTVDTARVDETLRIYGRQPDAVRSFFMATQAIRDRRLPHQLKGLPSKVLVLYGTHDRLVPNAVIEELTQVLPKVVSQIHDGGGHHLQEDEPEWVADHLTRFLAST